jgi:tetratricopeptide (TPR) repeat protein
MLPTHDIYLYQGRWCGAISGRSSVLQNGRVNEKQLRMVEAVTLHLDGEVENDAQRVVEMVLVLVYQTFGDDPQVSDLRQAATLMNAAGVLINAAVRQSDSESLRTAEDWLTRIVRSSLLDGSRFASAALYNLANSRISICDLHSRQAWLEAEPTRRTVTMMESRFADRERLRSARSELALAAALSDNGRDRGMRLCNLANAFDQSGRWVEAYDAYVRALDADPKNGNAAGNVAVLIGKVIGNGWDFEGHLCTLYDHYLTWAQANRSGTVEVAGEDAARRYDAMKLLGTNEPFVAPFDEQDPYQAWVARHRLALVAGLEGLGSSTRGRRWDTIAVRAVTDTSDAMTPPPIIGILNVLKADFLVARRLAFEADQSIEKTGGRGQANDDPGVYLHTFNDAVYGEAPSKLVLAHRAAMDVLDKTAVAVNEHLQIGDNPRTISFRKFWFEDKTGTQLRSALMHHEALSTAILSMAELALDMAPGGLYSHAQDVRNAGTHRFVLVHHGRTDIETTATMQAMPLDGMRETCHQSLTVARAALLYLFALLDVFESSNHTRGTKVALRLPEAY